MLVLLNMLLMGVRFRVPDTTILSEYTRNLLEFYNVTPQKISIIDSSNIPLPNEDLDLIIYRDPGIVSLGPRELDSLLIESQERLRTMGVLVFEMSDRDVGQAYARILEDPKELWEYNLVSPLIQNCSISCRKGSSMVFKDRPLERMTGTVYEGSRYFDVLPILQYTILFKVFSLILDYI